MRRLQRFAASVVSAALLLVGTGAFLPSSARAQEEGAPPAEQDTTVKTTAPLTAYPNIFTGEFTPGNGFDIIRTERGSLNVSVYGLFRWVDQMPGEQTFTDHLGGVRTVKARNDLNWHRTFAWLTGFFGDQRFRYNISIWTLGATQQALVFGNLRYSASQAFTIGAAIGPNLTVRSVQGTWPYWASSDRQMSEEFERAGFSSGVFITGMPMPRFYYTGSVNTNLSQLGVTATNDSRDMAYSASVWVLPTTGEFGPRGGLGDFEGHKDIATRFGVSVCTARENRAAPVSQPNPNETQLRLSDGVYAFETGSLAPGVTVTDLDYHYASFDASAKYRGFSVLGEFYYRTLSNFAATGPVPYEAIRDRGFMLEAMQMAVPKTLAVYVVGGYLYDEFKRYPWEVAAGASLFPYRSRAWRVNLHVIRVEKCPTGSNFGFYTAGQTGTTLSLGTDFLF
jgi:hypothetical protein